MLKNQYIKINRKEKITIRKIKKFAEQTIPTVEYMANIFGYFMTLGFILVVLYVIFGKV